jgi:hypothetical protein
MRTSLISYTIGMVSAVFAFCTRQIVIGCLILAYAQMQLSELMIWYGIDNDSTDWNKRGTSFGKYLLATHNMAIGIGIILSIIFISKRKVRVVDLLPLIIGTLFFMYVVVFIYTPSSDYPSTTYPLKRTCNKCQNPENRLKWPYPHGWYIFGYVISVVIVMMYLMPYKSKVLYIIFFSALLFISVTIFPNTIGSVWCLSTSLIAPIFVLANYQIIKNMPNSNIIT